MRRAYGQAGFGQWSTGAELAIVPTRLDPARTRRNTASVAAITLNGVEKRYGDVVVVKRVDLAIADGEFVVLVGPSGCGKSTTLRMIAGLETISGGELLIDGKRCNDVPPGDRDLAMVFQSYALYPHMSVRDNIAFGLKVRKVPAAEIEQRTKDAAAMLGLDGLLERKPKQLSGGQR